MSSEILNYQLTLIPGCTTEWRGFIDSLTRYTQFRIGSVLGESVTFTFPESQYPFVQDLLAIHEIPPEMYTLEHLSYSSR